jgi:hypothetical protein
MIAGAMLYPAIVGGYGWSVRPAVQHAGKILLDTFAQADMGVVKDVADKINPTGGNREHLVVLFYSQVQIGIEVIPDILKECVQIFFTVGQKN